MGSAIDLNWKELLRFVFPNAEVKIMFFAKCEGSHVKTGFSCYIVKIIILKLDVTHLQCDTNKKKRGERESLAR